MSILVEVETCQHPLYIIRIAQKFVLHCSNLILLLRCSQVWFQNKRSKERRLKQLTSMGRGPFFGGSRKMRGFPMNLSPGALDEPPPGFPYFATADGKFEFGFGGPGPGFHHDFYPGHHPHQGQPLPFNGPGKYTALFHQTYFNDIARRLTFFDWKLSYS